MKRTLTLFILFLFTITVTGCGEKEETIKEIELSGAFQITEEGTYTYEFIDDKHVVISDGTYMMARFYEYDNNEGTIFDASGDIIFRAEEDKIFILGLDSEEYEALRINSTEKYEEFKIIGTWTYGLYEVPKYYEFKDDNTLTIKVNDDTADHNYVFENNNGTIDYNDEELQLIPYGEKLILIDDDGNSEILTKE